MKPPKVKAETVFQEDRALSELEQIKGQISQLKRAKSSVEAAEEEAHTTTMPGKSSSLPPIFESRVNRLKEKTAGYGTLWGSMHA